MADDVSAVNYDSMKLNLTASIIWVIIVDTHTINVAAVAVLGNLLCAMITSTRYYTIIPHPLFVLRLM